MSIIPSKSTEELVQSMSQEHRHAVLETKDNFYIAQEIAKDLGLDGESVIVEIAKMIERNCRFYGARMAGP